MTTVHGAYGATTDVVEVTYHGVSGRLTTYDAGGSSVCGWTCACGVYGFTSQARTVSHLRRDARALWRHHVRRGCLPSATSSGGVTVRHGDPHAYAAGCPCRRCLDAHRDYNRELRHRRYAAREWVNGRLVAVQVGLRHGRVSTYNNWGCRCDPCTRACRGRHSRR